MMAPRNPRRAALAAFIAAAVGLPVASASAATVRVAPQGDYAQVVAYTAAAGEANDVTLTSQETALVVHDGGAAVTAGPGCAIVDAHTASCALTVVRPMFAEVTLGDGDDRVAIAPHALGGPTLGLTAGGGDGNDVLDAANAWATSVLDGGGGADRVTGGRSYDLLADGDDSPDRLDGGGGVDGVDYGARTSGIAVDLAAGTSSRGDTLVGIEDVAGGAGNDRLRGDAGRNTLDGGPGRDVISGRGGEDRIGFPLTVFDGPRQGPLRASTARGDAVTCGKGRFDLVNGRRAADTMPASCEELSARRKLWFGSSAMLLVGRPAASGRYPVYCSDEEDWDDPRWAALRCSGTLTLREVSSHRLLARARIRRGRGTIVAHLRWTRRGRRLASRKRGVLARLHIAGKNLANARWTARVHRP